MPAIFQKNEKQICQYRFRQFITHLTTRLAFSPETLFDLGHNGLMPVFSFSPQSNCAREIETSMPVLNYKTVQWPLYVNEAEVSTLYFKLGTGNRVNHCHLLLEVTQNDLSVATAEIAGPTAQDNQWTAFTLTQPLIPGDYMCKLHSPDADNAVSTLFFWIEPAFKSKRGLLNYCYTCSSDEILQSTLNGLTQLPFFNLFLFAENTHDLSNSLASVQAQIYPHWELFVISLQPQVIDFCAQQALSVTQDCNAALTSTKDDYTIFLFEGDLLTKDALLEMATLIEQSDHRVDMLYSDEDCIGEQQVFDNPYFKPDWSVEFFKTQAYTGQLAAYQTGLLKQCINSPLKSAIQLWETIFRFAEQAQHIEHIPQILYHRAKQLPVVDSASTIQASLDRENLGGTVTIEHKQFILHYPVNKQPLVSIIIPTRDEATLLERCLNSLLQKTDYPHFEIIIVDNGSQTPATFELFESYQQQLNQRFRVVQCDQPFNFSQLVNLGVQQAQGEIILLLNNDMEFIHPCNWLREMIGFVQHPEIGCVSAKLLYPQNDTIQHAGIVCGIGGIGHHGHRYFPSKHLGYFNRLSVVNNVSAVTGACLMVEKTLWEKVDGFDEKLAIAYNDIDFCLKLQALEFRHVVLPQITFYHYESKSRGLDTTQAKQSRLSNEQQYMQARWQDRLTHDPNYNPNLILYREDFAISPDSVYYCVNYEELPV